MEGTDAARLADCLGLDVSKYRGSSSGEATADELREEALLASAASLDDDALYKVQLQLGTRGQTLRDHCQRPCRSDNTCLLSVSLRVEHKVEKSMA